MDWKPINQYVADDEQCEQYENRRQDAMNRVICGAARDYQGKTARLPGKEAKEDMLSLQGTTQLSAMSYHHKNVKPKNQKNGISNNKQHSSRSKTTGKYKDFTAM
ncbi:unnamed protein product [Onchocerca ochengi]|uniref:SUZ domain-containing protein n=1 Tax=Onchocerca ochengi TaxID=42157 RepID=A0A182EQA6_ONCOC|nr:unnamed protein product [Onchocerca ochengi]